ncbi:GntR family transcriptional regulator [Alcaligenes endophyticus]|uniref:GntR family transcriptional regulator n=1 Tax=Alcaligenes endophyticus TaxID=1929088 RepID=A0ABT8EMS4_9BURK|nr:GntR family transcriptional regulator [Alcaligenes endophyticus]MCX5591518.1 GntR family transcriptional regulator [Alcaligenes endophyticus]MDN4122601.1 GntR family transcriptional regulator [Alcaligenes endophyticus]
MSRSVPPSRAAETAYQAIEQLIATLKLEPGQAIVDSDLVELTGLGRTPIREALMRMVAMGLIEQQPRRGLRVSEIRVAEHLTLIETRRVLERLIVQGAARWASPAQRSSLLTHAQAMVAAADAKDIDAYMLADHHLDELMHVACRNTFAVQAVIPMIVQCRRFWYAFQYEGDLEAGAQAHLTLAEGIQDGNPEMALRGAEALMEYLSAFTRKVIE